MYDAAIIGGGVIGCAVAEQLARYKLNIAVIERSNDVADGTTKANSGIVHAGYDAPENTLMAQLNVRGSRKMPEECRRLDVAFRRIGSYVLSLCKEDDAHLERLLQRGWKNGVENLEILPGEVVRKREPALTGKVRCALYAPAGAVVDPFALCVSYAELAAENGADFLLSHQVEALAYEEGHWNIRTSRGEVHAIWIINAAGVHADQIQEMAGEHEFTITPVRGEYYIMDKILGNLVHAVIFQCPGPMGKGVLVSPTVHGNLIVGPNAEPVGNPDDTKTTRPGLDSVRKAAARTVPDIPYCNSIRNFAGVRANSDIGDFIIRLSESAPHFLNVAGIGSPGLSSAPAIAEYAVAALEKAGLVLRPKEDVMLRRHGVHMKDLTPDEKQNMIEKDPRYGRVLCRCETVTEGEIRDALRRKPCVYTVDSVKKRAGAGMGRCQGSFCLPRIMALISEETGIPQQDILLGPEGSHILAGNFHDA